MPVAALISTDPTNGSHKAGVPFKFDASPKIGAFSSTVIHYFTTLNSLTSRDCATFQTNRICSVEARAVCSARGDANSHGNDLWVRIVKSQDSSPPVELHRKFPVASLLLRLGRQRMSVKLCAQCDRRIVKPVIAIRQNCQRATPRRCQPGLVRRYRVCVLRRALQRHSSTASEFGFSFALLTSTCRTIGESTVYVQTETLGGRLPLLEPSSLSTAQKETYERLNRTWISWANDVPFQSKLEDGDLSVRSIRYSSAPRFRRAFRICRKPNKTTRR